MIVYISGPMSGLPEFNYPAFHAAAESLRSAGFQVINPAETAVPQGSAWLAFMRDAVCCISRSDAVATLPGWRRSKGAGVEVRLARGLGFPIRPVPEWLARAIKSQGETSQSDRTADSKATS